MWQIRYKMEAISDDIFQEFLGQVGWLGAQHRYTGDSDWVDFITASKAFMISIGLVNGKVPFEMDDIKKKIINELCRKDLLEFKKTEKSILLRVKRLTAEQEEELDKKKVEANNGSESEDVSDTDSSDDTTDSVLDNE